MTTSPGRLRSTCSIAAETDPKGLHMATQGGLWQAVVLGCGGLSAADGVLHLDPRLATGWNRLRFSLTHHGVPATGDAHPDHRHGRSGRRVDRRCSLPGVRTTAAAGRPAELVLRDGGWHLPG